MASQSSYLFTDAIERFLQSALEDLAGAEADERKDVLASLRSEALALKHPGLRVAALVAERLVAADPRARRSGKPSEPIGQARSRLLEPNSDSLLVVAERSALSQRNAPYLPGSRDAAEFVDMVLGPGVRRLDYWRNVATDSSGTGFAVRGLVNDALAAGDDGTVVGLVLGARLRRTARAHMVETARVLESVGAFGDGDALVERLEQILSPPNSLSTAGSYVTEHRIASAFNKALAALYAERDDNGAIVSEADLLTARRAINAVAFLATSELKGTTVGEVRIPLLAHLVRGGNLHEFASTMQHTLLQHPNIGTPTTRHHFGPTPEQRRAHRLTRAGGAQLRRLSVHRVDAARWLNKIKADGPARAVLRMRGPENGRTAEITLVRAVTAERDAMVPETLVFRLAAGAFVCGTDFNEAPSLVSPRGSRTPQTVRADMTGLYGDIISGRAHVIGGLEATWTELRLATPHARAAAFRDSDLETMLVEGGVLERGEFTTHSQAIDARRVEAIERRGFVAVDEYHASNLVRERHSGAIVAFVADEMSRVFWISPEPGVANVPGQTLEVLELRNHEWSRTPVAVDGRGVRDAMQAGQLRQIGGRGAKARWLTGIRPNDSTLSAIQNVVATLPGRSPAPHSRRSGHGNLGSPS